MTPSVGIIIPTYNRAEHLLQCLRHLEVQTNRDFQVLIVDDGSTDNTAVELAQYLPTAPFPLQVIHQPNSGPARARNLALSHCTSPICLFIGDDTFPAPTFVAAHLDFHLAHPQQSAAALGLTRWSSVGQVVTPLMRWLEADGAQFDYRRLLNGEPATWEHFYTSNLSLKTAFLGPSPFDESFHSYGMEDIELGYRLAKLKGLTVTFLPHAIVEHLHPTNFRTQCRRATKIGAAEFRFHQLWPEFQPHNSKTRMKRLLLLVLSEHRVVLPVFNLVTRLVSALILPNPLLPRLLRCYRFNGYRRAQNSHFGRPAAVDHTPAKPVC